MKKRAIVCSLFLGPLLIICLPLQAQLAGSQWPMFQCNPQHTGQSSYVGPVWGKLLWSYEFAGDYLESQPSVGPDGRVYQTAYDNNITALDSTGTLVWSYVTDGDLDSTPAISSNGTIYAGSHDDNVYALTSAGSLLWSYNTNDLVRSSPAIASDGSVYVDSTSNCFKFSSGGSLSWSYYLLGSGLGIFCSPVLSSDEIVYSGSDDNNLYALNSNGSLSWSYLTGHRIRSSQAVDSADQVYTGSSDGNLYKLTQSGSLLWSYDASTSVYSPSIGSDGRVFPGSSRDNLQVLSSTGILLWSYEAGNDVWSPAIDSDGRLYISSYDNNIYGLLSDGSLLWSYTVGYYNYCSPVLGSDRSVYLASADNVLYCFKDPTPTPTPTPPLEIIPSALQAGASFSFTIKLHQDINQAFDYYVVVNTPFGPYTLFFNGTVEKEVTALYRNVQGYQAYYEKTVTPGVLVPGRMAGQDVTFMTGAVEAGRNPGVPLDQISVTSPYMIMFDKRTVTVSP